MNATFLHQFRPFFSHFAEHPQNAQKAGNVNEKDHTKNFHPWKHNESFRLGRLKSRPIDEIIGEPVIQLGDTCGTVALFTPLLRRQIPLTLVILLASTQVIRLVVNVKGLVIAS